MRSLLFLGVFLLPVDYFMPTAEAFREAGAKPSIIVFALLALLSRLSRPPRAPDIRTSKLMFMFLGILTMGTLAFSLNLIAGWSDLPGVKTPIVQFVAQAAMLLLFACVTLELTQLFAADSVRQYVWRIIPMVAIIHFGIFGLEAAGILSDEPGTVLGLFRADGGIIERPTGLMSEPSYFGALAGLFGFPLLVFDSPRKWRNRLLALALIAAAFSIRAKTVVPVCGLQLLGWLWFRRDHISWPVRLTLVAAFLSSTLIYVTSVSALDFEENLSSAMRLGSTWLSVNVATSGYGLSGIGFGQFHFFYRPDFAPDFLMLSEEALNQMAPDSPGRASTYNLFVRVLVEGGLVAFGLFILVILKGLSHAGRHYNTDSLFARLLTLGSLGFLLTQDTYFYPPLCLGLAICHSFRTPRTGGSSSALAPPQRVTSNMGPAPRPVEVGHELSS